MQILKTRREFLCDASAFSITVALNDSILNKILPPLHTIGAIKIDRNDWPEEQINICYLGLGSTGMEIGSRLSAYLGTPLQKVNLCQDNCLPFSFSHNSWKDKLEKHIGKKSMTVLVSDVDVPIFFELRQFVISRTPCIWTICMVSEAAEKDIYDLHYAPNEIMRISRSTSFPYQDIENFIQSILAIYMVQHSYRHNNDFSNIYAEALDGLGI